jgi:hypothetical protein
MSLKAILLRLSDIENPVPIGGAKIIEIPISWSAGQSLSEIVCLGKGETLVGILLPATLAGDSCKIRRSKDGTSAGVSVQDSYGSEQAVLLNGTAAYRAVPDVATMVGVNYVQLYTTLAGAAQAQAAAQTATLVVKALS